MNSKHFSNILFILIPFICSFGALFYFSFIPDFCCDVYQYIHISQSFDSHGFLYPHSGSELRNYFYPYLLSIFAGGSIYNLTSFLSFSKLTIFFMVFISSFFFMCSMNRTIKNVFFSSLIVISLFLNPLLATIYTLPLTELYVFPLVVFLLCISNVCLSQSSSMSFFYKLTLFFLFPLILSFLILLRPANLILIFPSFILLFYFVIISKANMINVFSFIFFLICPFFPQLYFNSVVFNEISILPVGGLGAKQFYWGLTYVKYGTFYIDGIAEGMKYRTWLTDELLEKYSSSSLFFYIKEAPSSILLLLAHIFNSLNYDFLFTYVNEREYRIISWHQILSSVMTVLGFTYVWFLLASWRNYKSRLNDYFLVLILFSFLAMNSVVAVETRFGMVPHMILTILSSLLFINLSEVRLYINFKVFWFLGLLYVALSTYISYIFVSGLGGVDIVLM